MSSQLTTLVQTFDGSNYQLWSKAMKAWLQSQGLWGFVDGTVVRPADPAAGAAAADIAAAEAAIAAWVRSNDIAMGNLVLRLNPSIQESLGAFTAAEAVWNDLRDRYGAATIPQVYKDFKEAINICINPNAHSSLPSSASMATRALTSSRVARSSALMTLACSGIITSVARGAKAKAKAKARANNGLTIPAMSI